MSVALSIAALLLSTPAVARDPCKVAGLTEQAFGATVIGGGGRIVRFEDGNQSAVISVGAQGIQGNPLPPGFELQWLLDDGTKVTLVSNQEAQPKAWAVVTEYTSAVGTGWEVQFPLNRQTIHAIAGAAPVAVRYQIGSVDRSRDLKTRRGRRIQAEYACAANLLPPEEAPEPD